MHLSTHKFDDVPIPAGRYIPSAHPEQHALATR